MRMSMRPASMAARKHAKKKPASRRGSTNILARLKSYVTYAADSGMGAGHATERKDGSQLQSQVCVYVGACGRGGGGDPTAFPVRSCRDGAAIRVQEMYHDYRVNGIFY